ncbi:MAG: DUF1772 domain-containing protein [Stenomitos rutilans HA7619-LM2]|jgi:uncharacterized membrane protein|nr:DUF1772 domain-containing protein [Stenomitos rutilans HA7619-LM2]
MVVLVLKTISVIVAGLMVGNELAVSAFVHPRLSALDDQAHAASAQALARVYGAVMPIWYAVVLILTVALTLVVPWSIATELAVVSAAIWLGSIIFTLVFPVPINNQVIRWNLDALPNNWKALRKQWDHFHAIRIVMLLLALTCLTVAGLIA